MNVYELQIRLKVRCDVMHSLGREGSWQKEIELEVSMRVNVTMPLSLPTYNVLQGALARPINEGMRWMAILVDNVIVV